MIWVLLLFTVIVAVAPFFLELRRPTVDMRREKAPGEFAELGDGLTHYQWFGPKDGSVLVCIHGLTTPSHVWDELTPALAEANFRILTYDLYGRGFSDRPSGAQTRSFFIRQLRELLQDQGVTGDITLFGHSMGGSIAAVFAAEEPDRVTRVILLAPAGLVHNPGKLAEITRKVPILGHWMMLAFGGWQLREGAKRQPGAAETVQKMANLQAEETRTRGYLPAVLSSQRNLLAETLDEEHRAIAAADLPVLAIWGKADTVIPITAMGRLAQQNPSARHTVISGAGHGLGYTHPTEIIAKLAEGLDA